MVFPLVSSFFASGKGRTLHAEARSFVLNVSVRYSCSSPFAARPKNSGVDRSWSFQRVRSQSFFSWRLHLNTSLRASAGPTASAQAVRSGPSGTVLFFATILRGQARPNHTDVRSGIAPDGSMSPPRTEQGPQGS